MTPSIGPRFLLVLFHIPENLFWKKCWESQWILLQNTNYTTCFKAIYAIYYNTPRNYDFTMPPPILLRMTSSAVATWPLRCTGVYSCVPSSLLVPLAKRVPHQDPPWNQCKVCYLIDTCLNLKLGLYKWKIGKYWEHMAKLVHHTFCVLHV